MSGNAKDRKAQIRAYKESPRTMGIFEVRNTVSGKRLIGSATDVPAMLNRQRAQLRLGAHPNAQLQADWNTLGADAFAFDVLDVLAPPDDPAYDPRPDLDVLQALWLEKLTPFGERGYHRLSRSSSE
jgi:hypothetical protein